MSKTTGWLTSAGIVALVVAAGVAVTRLAPDEAVAPELAAEAPASPEVVVYKTPTCACCGGWIAHMRAAGYRLRTVELDFAGMMAKKGELGVPTEAASCHTAVVGGQVVEGHVPAAVVEKMRSERPEAIGVAVPGMPAGSPGMGGDVGDGYQVHLLEAPGRAIPFVRVGADEPGA